MKKIALSMIFRAPRIEKNNDGSRLQKNDMKRLSYRQEQIMTMGNDHARKAELRSRTKLELDYLKISRRQLQRIREKSIMDSSQR